MKFNTEKNIKMNNQHLRMIRSNTLPIGSKTGYSFRIVNDLGKRGIFNVLKQYEINDWANEENLKKLKILIDLD